MNSSNGYGFIDGKTCVLIRVTKVNTSIFGDGYLMVG